MALMKQIWAKLVQHWPLIFLIFVVTLLFFANYLPGTWLSGWDTLHPEWNLGLYFLRTFFGAWQETYGLGAVSIQAFAAELPRLLVILPLTMFLQASDVRYGYFFLTLCFSALGAYYFISGALNKGKALSVIGAIFYILNPGALQIFALPFEMNITFFAALPWLLALATKYLEERKKKYLMWFLVATFFASPMAHTPTLFITYFVALFLYLAAYIAVIRK